MQRVVKIVRASWQWIALAAVAALGLTGYVWYQNYQDEQARLAALAALRTESIGRGDLVAVVSATGSLQPDRQASLFFLVPGTVQAVLVESGQTVTAGQVLARLNSAELRLAIAQAESGVEIAKLNRLKLLASPTDDDIAIAKANLRAANAAAADLQRGAGPQEAEIAKLQYDNARADYQAAADQYNSLVEFAEQNPRFAPSGEALDQL